MLVVLFGTATRPLRMKRGALATPWRHITVFLFAKRFIGGLLGAVRDLQVIIPLFFYNVATFFREP